MTLHLGLRIDGDAKGAVAALDQTEARIKRIAQAATGGPGSPSYAKQLAEAYGINERLNASQVKTIRNYETLIGATQVHGRQLAQFIALRKAGTSADSEYGRVIADLAGKHYDLTKAQDKTQQSGSNVADTLTRRLFGAFLISQIKNATSAMAAMNAEIVRTADIASRTGTNTGLFQGIQGAAQNKGIDSATIDDAMLKLSHGISNAKAGVGELGLLFRANNLTLGSTAETFFKIADLVKNAHLDSDKFAIAQQAGLPATREMVKFLEQGSEAIKRQAAAVKGLTDEQLQAQKLLNDRWNNMWADFERNGKKAIVSVYDFLRSNSLNSSLTRAGSSFSRTPIEADPGYDRDFLAPEPPKSKNPYIDQMKLQREIQNLSLLGQTTTATEARALAEKQLQLAIQQGATVDSRRVDTLARLAYEQKLGTAQIKAQRDAYDVEAATIGMATGAAEAYRAVQTRINEAIRNGSPLKAEFVAQLQKQADTMGLAAQRAENLQWGYENLVRGPLQELRTEIANGARGWDVMRAAAAKALDGISSKLMDFASQSAWKALTGGAGGTGVGGILAGLGIGAAPGAIGAGVGGSAYSIGFGGQMVPVFHGGRSPGSAAREFRHVDMSIFANAPKFHEGRLPFAAGEIPAIIRDDEAVIPKGKLGGGDAVNVNFNLTVNGGGQDGNSIVQALATFVRSSVFVDGVKAAVQKSRSRREAF